MISKLYIIFNFNQYDPLGTACFMLWLTKQLKTYVLLAHIYILKYNRIILYIYSSYHMNHNIKFVYDLDC